MSLLPPRRVLVIAHNHHTATIAGDIATLAVVDDPHGYVIDETSPRLPRYADDRNRYLYGVEHIDVGLHELTSRKIAGPIVYPEGRKKARKGKQRMKGLRP